MLHGTFGVSLSKNFALIKMYQGHKITCPSPFTRNDYKKRLHVCRVLVDNDLHVTTRDKMIILKQDNEKQY